MVRKEAVFALAEDLTPDVAAKLTQATGRFQAHLEMECDGKRVLMDSLIGILSVDCRRGTRLAVIAEGEDEAHAAEAMAALLEGRREGKR